MLREGFTSKSDYICACIAESKISHHLSTMGLAVVFRRLRQRLASFLHSFRSCCKVRASLRKTTPFLRFQSCQQQSAKNILKCSLGMWGGHDVWRSSEVGRVGGRPHQLQPRMRLRRGNRWWYALWFHLPGCIPYRWWSPPLLSCAGSRDIGFCHAPVARWTT
jgi:hypothetical protein